MAHIYRLVVVLLCAWSGVVSASSYYVVGFPIGAAGSSRTQACVNVQGAGSYVTLYAGQWYCFSSIGGGGYSVQTLVDTSADDLKSLLDGLNGLADRRVWVQGGASALGRSFCKDGVVVTGDSAAVTYDGTQHIVYGPYSSDGVDCDGGTPAVDTATTCASGTFPGTVNGLSVCVPRVPSNTVAQGPSVAASSPSGAASTPLGSGPAGAVSSGQTTSCTGSACTTVTTYKDGSGTIIGTITKDQPKSSFCSENPGLSICTNSTYSSASCSSVPTCTGDAIQCAIAKSAFETKCAMTDSAGDVTAYNAAKGSLTGDVTGGAPGSTSVSLSGSNFDQTERLGAAMGASDITTEIAGNSVTVEFSQVNPWLERLGYLLLAVTAIICARIVMGSQTA